ncbi:cell wall-binding repeat-containing protein [Clostridium lundense]|uniref:cell wall-binding repeat-containing protein n=1 Tax=Clostridium lundense TaxID=319475 RepID=UPI000684F479|nr:cell wall-binding repeat-containing protein [Clostridium lundense]
MEKRINFSLRKIYSKFAVMLTLSMFLSPMMVKAEANSFERISGNSRYETSAAISKNGWTSSQYVVIAQGENFPDALCSVPLAKKYNAPILLTTKDKLNSNVENEIKRLGAKNIILIGGEASVSSNLEKYIRKTFSNASVERIAGKDRYETSAKIAEKLDFKGEVVLASSMYYADALAIAPIAGKKGMPILLTEKNNLSVSAKNYLKDKNINKTYIVGGNGVISNNIEKEIKNPYRIAGQDRFETNVEILKAFNSDINYSNVITALGKGPKGNEFADALSGAALAAKIEAPMVLSYSTLPQVTENYLNNIVSDGTKVYALGGEAVLPSSAVSKIKPNVKIYNDDSTVVENTTINNTTKIKGNNISLKNITVNGDLYITGDKCSIDNAKINGNVFVQSNKNISLNLKNNSLTSQLVLDGQIEVTTDSYTTIAKAKVTGEQSLIKLNGKFGEVQIENGKKVELTTGTTLDKLTSIGDKGKTVTIDVAKDVKVKAVSGELNLTGAGASGISNNTQAPSGGGGGGVAQGEGPKVTKLYLKGSDGTIINGNISGNDIRMEIRKNYDKKIVNVIVTASDNIATASAMGNDITKEEMDKVFGSNRNEIDLMKYIRSKGFDPENDGVAISNITLLDETRITLKDANGKSTTYKLYVK